MSKLSSEDRRQKFGWMNRETVTAEQKRAVWESSLKRWWDNATPEQREDVVARKCESVVKFCTGVFYLYDNSLPEDHPTNAWASNHKRPDFCQIFEV